MGIQYWYHCDNCLLLPNLDKQESLEKAYKREDFLCVLTRLEGRICIVWRDCPVCGSFALVFPPAYRAVLAVLAFKGPKDLTPPF
jgi:hypothetical protein